ncbi:MAG: glutaredoxin family protein [Chloroflexi bacterium]|nr:glutaredoxin family protein [Chloroflexota bacterium]
MLTVTLFTKEGCGLCDEVKVTLDELQATLPHKLKEVDISEDVALFEKYRYAIPVLEVGEQILTAPITAVELKRTLEAEIF